MSNLERTLSIIKPDAVERNLTEEIKSILIKNKLEIKEIKKIHITKDEAAEFYKVHQTKPFYNDLCSYLSSGPIVVMVLEGKTLFFHIGKLWAQLIQNKLKIILLENYTVYLLIRILCTVLTL